MILSADYHTHTVFSHGKGKIIDNALVAKEKGLKEVAITDHGFSHPAFGLRSRKLPKMRALCDQATEQTGVKVLLGVESNIIGTDGKIDLKEKNYDYFDTLVAGVHKFVMYKFGAWFTLAIPNWLNSIFNRKNVSKRLIKENTKTFINVIKNNPVDIITHLNYCCYADPVEVAKCARDYGTYIELSSKKVHLSDEDIFLVAQTGVKFILNSDAHKPHLVGDISLMEQTLKRVDINKEQIANIDGKIPEFRFRAFKEGR